VKEEENVNTCGCSDKLYPYLIFCFVIQSSSKRLMVFLVAFLEVPISVDYAVQNVQRVPYEKMVASHFLASPHMSNE
jgi:hypothetical protein